MIDDKLSEVFDMYPYEEAKSEIIPTATEQLLPTNGSIDHDQDYDLTRSNIHGILQQGQDALTHALSVAKQSEHPRAFEVVGGLMKHLSDINIQLLDVHKKKQTLDNPKGSIKEEGKNVTNNAIFVGSTSELSKILNDLKKGK